MLEPATFLGLGGVAIWAYRRYPRLRPKSLLRAATHVAVAFVGFTMLPSALAVLLPYLQAPVFRVTVLLGLLFATLTYVLLSWVWLIARIIEMFGGKPRGGHPVAHEH